MLHVRTHSKNKASIKHIANVDVHIIITQPKGTDKSPPTSVTATANAAKTFKSATFLSGSERSSKASYHQWTDQLVARPPTARSYHGFTSADGTVQGTLYVHGGQDENGTALSDLHAYDPVAQAWMDLSSPASGTPPTARSFHGFTSAGGRLYVYGGLDWMDNAVCDLHAYDPVAQVWTDLSSPASGRPPTARFSHGFTSADGKLYAHGGVDANAAILSELHAYDPVAQVWMNLSSPGVDALPRARFSHCFTSASGKLYVHGGKDEDYNALGDLHAFDPVAKAWMDLSHDASGTAPSVRFSHGFTSADGKLYVHGGGNGGKDTKYTALSDLLVFDPVAQHWTDLSSPTARAPRAARSSHGFARAASKSFEHGEHFAIDETFLQVVGDLDVFDAIA